MNFQFVTNVYGSLLDVEREGDSLSARLPPARAAVWAVRGRGRISQPFLVPCEER